MRKLAIIMALASTAIAGPALARDKAWYIGVEGGGMIVENLQFDIAGLPAAATVKNREGFDADGIVGYDFGGFRLEGEVGYKEASVQSYTSNTTTFRGGGFVAAPAGTGPARGKTTALSFMVNGLLDFGDDDGISGFVGGGAGVARVKESNYAINAGSFLNDSDTRFAYQGLAGVRGKLTDHIDATFKYRFFNVDGIRTIDALGRAERTRFRSHSLLGGITYNFGEPPAPPPPPAPAMAPPPPPEAPAAPPPAPVCTPGAVIVFFDWNKSDITPEAGSLLDGAVSNYANCGNAAIEIRGYTDTSGTPKYNLGLSQRRSDSVSAYLQSKGIAGGVITTKALGETNLRVPTADGVRELQNRRVEINYGTGAGM